MIHEVQIFLIVGGDRQLRQYGRRHVQGIAPPPEILLPIVGASYEFVHPIAGWIDPLTDWVLSVEGKVSEPDRLIVGVLKTRSKIPLVLLGGLKHAIVVALFACGP